MTIPDRQTELDRFIAQHFRKPAREAESNGSAHRFKPSPPRSDDEVLRACRAAKNAAKFSDLYDHGDVDRYHAGDDSSADAGLMEILAFQTQDEHQLEYLFNQSALGQREKWNKRPDYRRRTINYVLGELRDTWQPHGSDGTRLIVGGSSKTEPQDKVHSRSHSLGREGMRNDPEQNIRAVSFRGREKPGPREWIVDRAICKGHPASWYGESGIAKSLLAAHMALHIAADGIDYWAGLRVQTVPVIYGDFELDEDEHLRRAQELAAGMGLPDVPMKFHYLPLAGLPANEAFKIAAEECSRLKAGLFIVDSVGFALDGDSELAKDVLRFYRECIQPIRAAGATPHLIDHQAKIIKGEKYSDKQEFGSVYKTNAVRSSFQIRGAWDGNELTATFTHKKTNFGPKVDDFSLKLVFGDDRIEVARLKKAVPNPDREPSKREQVLGAILGMGQATAETAAQKTGLNLKTVQNAISEYLAEGMLVDTGKKEGRSRIVIPHSHTTQGTGTGATDEDDLLSGEPKVVGIESGEPYDVYVGRGKRGTGLKKSKWHNPFVIDRDGGRGECVEKFERYLTQERPDLMEQLPELRGKILGCHCAPERPCHGDVLLRLANAGDPPDPDKGVADEQKQRIRKLVREGMSERLAREEVLGKGWVAP